ncbi:MULTISPECIES: hypothetical protein [Clostridium]|uniref:Uncharacterized protein n=1 Tax=Clostridium frigoriphilum TaxID=443253 RepID=A0ABU7UJA7_9CLOT|nr:hypothetical protein [Clostridium sp. DSM 17811]MBU3098403.1 hypothetical protein [Clostridium sp. DSM 17811]
MAQCINVSFKNNDKEMKMYMEAVSHSGRVNWIKDCIKFYMNYGHMEKQLKELLEKENKKEQ